MEEGWELEEGEEEKMEEEEEKERVGEEGIEEDIFLEGIVMVRWESEYYNSLISNPASPAA